MVQKLYAANIPLTVSEEDIYDLFVEFGPIVSVERAVNQRTEEPREVVMVEMENKEDALLAIEKLNGYAENDDPPLFVTLPTVPRDLPFTSEMKALVRELTDMFEESDQTAKRQLRRIVHFAGVPFAKALLENTRAVEEAGGLMVRDETRRRTPGGVFFFLARKYLAPKVQRAVFYAKTERPKAKNKKASAAKNNQAKGKGKGKGKSGAVKEKKAGELFAPVIIEEEPVVEKVVPTREPTPEVEQEYRELVEAYQSAQQQLADIQSQDVVNPADVFAANKELWQIESQMRTLTQLYRGLE